MPIEDLAISQLLSSVASRRHQVQLFLQELMSYDAMLRRQRVIMSLEVEKEIIRKALVDYLEKISMKMSAKKKQRQGRPRYVDSILWCSMQGQKVS